MRSFISNYLKVTTGVVFGLMLADRLAALAAVLCVSCAVAFMALDRD